MCAQGVAMPFVELFSQSFAQVRHLVMLVEREYGAQYRGEDGASVPLVEVDVLNGACRRQNLRLFFPGIIQKLGRLVALPPGSTCRGKEWAHSENHVCGSIMRTVVTNAAALAKVAR